MGARGGSFTSRASGVDVRSYNAYLVRYNVLCGRSEWG